MQVLACVFLFSHPALLNILSRGIGKLLTRIASFPLSWGPSQCCASKGATFRPRGWGECPGLRVVLFVQCPLCLGLSRWASGSECERRPCVGTAVLVIEAGGLDTKQSTIAGVPSAPDRSCSASSLGCAHGSWCWGGSGSADPGSRPYRYFLTHGASVAVVNSEGEVPSDLAEEPAMKDLLLEQVKKQGNPGVCGQSVRRPLRATHCCGTGGGRTCLHSTVRRPPVSRVLCVGHARGDWRPQGCPVPRLRCSEAQRLWHSWE